MMNKEQKKQLEELAQLLEQAHREIEGAISSHETANALQLLEDCQESAICLGELIEKEEGEGFFTVSLLEEYCELIFQLHEQLAQDQEVDGHKTLRSLNELSARIQNSIKRDIKVRKEVVFLPYKASMWDSLESVWKAADEDPDCDAYVIPIPYYDRNPDGSLGQLHYEGKQFPPDVPITKYQDYDLEKRRPDIAFYHNPYDDSNRVTCVYPSYYSRNLKQYAERLVYIPYSIWEEIDPKDSATIKRFAHLCFTTGVLNADKVFVQSKNIRQIYIDVLTSQFGPKTRARWEKTIYGTGSPKVDKVLCTRKEEQVIPPEWQRMIQKPDGTQKKIIFYNTSIAALLDKREKMLDKMQDVFRVFREHQEEFALLWRPHPLLNITITSMLPHLWMDYQKLVKSYCTEGFGIYDDTPDMNRAIALCDACYGDFSSLAPLCRMAGKAVMLQNTEINPCKNTISDNGNRESDDMDALLQEMLEKSYEENENINLYTLFALPYESADYHDREQLCGTTIWNQCKKDWFH